MSYTTTQLSELKAAYARGALKVRLPDGSEIIYRSLDEMERVIARIDAELGNLADHTNVMYPTHRRGFD